MAQIERLGRISEQFLVARKCVFAWKMLRKWHKKQKKPLLGAKSLGRLFYQNNLPNMAEKEGFEPSKPLWGLHDFQSCALGRTTRLLRV